MGINTMPFINFAASFDGFFTQIIESGAGTLAGLTTSQDLSVLGKADYDQLCKKWQKGTNKDLDSREKLSFLEFPSVVQHRRVIRFLKRGENQPAVVEGLTKKVQEIVSSIPNAKSDDVKASSYSIFATESASSSTKVSTVVAFVKGTIKRAHPHLFQKCTVGDYRRFINAQKYTQIGARLCRVGIPFLGVCFVENRQGFAGICALGVAVAWSAAAIYNARREILETTKSIKTDVSIPKSSVDAIVDNAKSTFKYDNPGHKDLTDFRERLSKFTYSHKIPMEFAKIEVGVSFADGIGGSSAPAGKDQKKAKKTAKEWTDIYIAKRAEADQVKGEKGENSPEYLDAEASALEAKVNGIRAAIEEGGKDLPSNKSPQEWESQAWRDEAKRWCLKAHAHCLKNNIQGALDYINTKKTKELATMRASNESLYYECLGIIEDYRDKYSTALTLGKASGANSPLAALVGDDARSTSGLRPRLVPVVVNRKARTSSVTDSEKGDGAKSKKDKPLASRATVDSVVSLSSDEES